MVHKRTIQLFHSEQKSNQADMNIFGGGEHVSLILALGRQRQVDLYDIKISLVHTASTGPARTT